MIVNDVLEHVRKEAVMI